MFLLRLALAAPICVVALFLPYGPRIRLSLALAHFVHLPYLWFGAVSRIILTELKRDE
ncbi:MAG: hypothetical protein HUU37_09655 [Bdellovibrionales bacterium]|nr:hypothetical protein [Bdellovibrionales bacterium]